MPRNQLRVTVVQDSVLRYRLSFYNSIASFKDIHLKVCAGVIQTSPGEGPPTWFQRIGVNKKLLFGFEWQSQIRSIDLSETDILVLSANIRKLSNLILVYNAWRNRIPIIWWGHYHSAGSSTIAKKMRRMMYQFGDAVMFYTDNEVSRYLSDGGKLPTIGLNNGIDTRQVVEFRPPIPMEDRPRRALFLGRLTGKARFDILLEALTHREAKGIEISVIGAECPIVREQVEALGLGQRVYWHGPRYSEPEIAEIANLSRIFVYPGAVGLSAIHAMAYGLPVLVHDDPDWHMPEIAAFSEGETGSTFRRNDSADLARQLATMIDDTEALASQSIAARARVAAKFNTETMAVRFAMWVRQVAENKSL